MFGCFVGMMDRNMWMPFDLRAFMIMTEEAGRGTSGKEVVKAGTEMDDESLFHC
jgi:hypothetical protein